MEVSVAEDEASTAIDAGALIALIRRFLQTSAGPSGEQQAQGAEAGTHHDLAPASAAEMAADAPEGAQAQTSEEAGCLLWDLSSGQGAADIMVKQGVILDVLETVMLRELTAAAPAVAEGAERMAINGEEPAARPAGLQPLRDPLQIAGSSRTLEIAVGILGNLATFDNVAVQLSQQAGLLQLAAQLAWLAATPPLVEFCRLGSVALRKPGAARWLAALGAADACERLLWVANSTLDAQLHARVLDLLVALVHADQQLVKAEGHAADQDPAGIKAAAQDAAAAGSTGGATGAGAGPGATTETLLRAGLLSLVQQVLELACKSHPSMNHHAWHDPAHEAPHGSQHHRGSAGARSSAPTGAGGMGGGGQPAATPLPSAQDVGPQLDPESVDAALRVVEELAACDVGQAALEAQPGVLDAMVGLLGADPSPQVLESLLLVMVDLGPWVARRLAARGVPHLMQLVESLGELGSGQQQLREGVLYLLAMGLRHLQQSTTQQLYAARGNASASPAAAGGRSDGGSNVATGSSPTGAGKDVSQQAGTPSKTGSIGAGASNSSMSPSKGASAALGSGGRSAGAAAGAAAAAAGVATHLAVRSKKDAEVLLELGERVARLPSLPGTDSEDAAKYTRAAATSMLALLDQVQSRAGASAGSGGGGGGSHGGAPPGLAELLGSKRWSQALSGLEGVAQGV